jgi:hypothetical protein
MLMPLLAACGHKASQTECEFIVDRNVEVQMKAMQITDPLAIAKKKEEFRSDPQTRADMNGCIGKRVTDKMIACVGRATTTDEIEQCMR